MPEYDEPQPYHRVLRTRSYRGWRPVIGLLVLIVSYVVLSTIVQLAILVPALLSGRISLPDTSGGLVDAVEFTAALINDPLGLLLVGLSVAVFIPAAILAIVAGHQMRPAWLHSVVGRMRWGFLGLCLVVAGVMMAGFFVLTAVASVVAGIDGEEVTSSGEPQLLLALVVLLVIPFQAAGEEYAVRGYGLQALGAWFRHPAIPILVTSLVFSAMHLGADLPAFVWFFMFGVATAYVTIRTGGLEAAIALHVVWNVSQLLLLSLSGMDAGDAFSGRAESSWVLPLVGVPLFLAYTVAVIWLAKWRGLATHTLASAPRTVPEPAVPSLAGPYPPRYP